MADPRNTQPLPLPPLALLVCGAALTAASHTLWLPYWVDAAAAALLIWRAIASIRGTALPARWLQRPNQPHRAKRPLDVLLSEVPAVATSHPRIARRRSRLSAGQSVFMS